MCTQSYVTIEVEVLEIKQTSHVLKKLLKGGGKKRQEHIQKQPRRLVILTRVHIQGMRQEKLSKLNLDELLFRQISFKAQSVIKVKSSQVYSFSPESQNTISTEYDILCPQTLDFRV